jgi:hypothetical protein
MGVQPFNGKGPHPLLWAGSRAAREKLTISGITNRLHYCVEFVIYAQFTNLAADRRSETHDLKVYEINDPGRVLGIKFQNLMQMTGVIFLYEISVHSDTFLRACTRILTFIGQTGSPCQVKCNALWNKGKTPSPLT